MFNRRSRLSLPSGRLSLSIRTRQLQLGYELCFSGEKMAKTATAALANPTESERSQSHYSNGTNVEKVSTDCDNGRIDVFRWSRCKKPLPQPLMLSIGSPLPLENVEVLEDNLE